MPLHKDDPKSLGGYRLVDRLGAGGMGVVYRGRARSGRDVAVKVVHAQYAADAVFRTRFRQEIEAVRKVSGAFTAPVVDADPEADRPWMATQYVPGRSLASRIRELGPLPEERLRRLALGLVEALRDIHRAGVVHRDLKPANVLLADDGPRVIDFGISRAAENLPLTETGQMIGTPPFMSPEQLTDARSVGPPSDVFSLGALLTYTLTGRGPFDADSPYLTAYRVVHDEPVLDGVRQPLRSVLERCLAKDPAERPGLDHLAQEFARLLPEEDPADDLPTVTPGGGLPHESDTGAPPFTAPARRHRRLRPALAATGAVVLALTAYLLTVPGWAEVEGEGDGGTVSEEAAASSRWAVLPDGWQPWQTTVHATAERGVRKGRTVADYQSDAPQCRVHRSAVYCAGAGVLPMRIDGLTGRVDWRAGVAPPGTGEGSYEYTLLGTADDALLVQQKYFPEPTGGEHVATVVALDTKTGKRLWHREVNPRWTDGAYLADDLVVVPEGDGSTVTARSPRTGDERWTAPLPKDLYCGLLNLVDGPFLTCGPGNAPAEQALLVRFDPEDGKEQRVTVPSEGTPVGTLDGRLLILDPAEDEEGNPATGDTGPFSRIRRVDPESGRTTTTKLAERFEGNVTLSGGTLWFTGTSGRVTAVSAETGKKLWRTPTSLEEPSGVTHDPRNQVVYMASVSGRVAALDAGNGELLWETLPRAERVTSTWQVPRVLLDRGAVVVNTPDGDVFSLDPAHPDRKPVSG
ncbi:serine/threonine protein kinase [Streptomyces sp. NBRC 14336]|uniref:serine/threonine-protein kinase n=1 Tax=Streptomyces sp. NBRC 14336 TaxID=3030992 RepID=UPI0024A3DDCF|nr:serine/threonine-protein kinase [Streptomyces sp. NBRC 14336]GLW51110.1 serine/threonine protein kinase [Streptomyces sp. NBRC 14336]